VTSPASYQAELPFPDPPNPTVSLTELDHLKSHHCSSDSFCTRSTRIAPYAVLNDPVTLRFGARTC